MRMGGDGAPRHRARRVAHASAYAHAAAHAETSEGGAGSLVGVACCTRDGGWRARSERASRQSWLCWYSETRRAAHAREHPPHCHICTSARSLWLCSLLLGRSCSGQPASRWGGWLVAGGLRRAARPARAWIGLLPLSCLVPPSCCWPNSQRGFFFTPFPSPTIVPPIRTSRGLVARGVPARARRARVMGVPRAAAAAAAAPSSASFECWRARALARCTLALRSRCAHAALALRCTHAGLREAGA